MIEEVAPTMDRAKLEQLVDRLNETDRSAIDAMWEVIWIAALARGGQVVHEPAFPGATRFPDVHFQNSEIEFVADVATVSDAGYESENPVDRLRDELDRLFGKYGLNGGGFGLSQIPARHLGEYGDSKVRLMLPPLREMPAFVRQHFGPMVCAVAAAPEKNASCMVEMPGGEKISFSYRPERRPYGCSFGHLSFDVPYSLTRNPVANALKAKKQQLLGINFGGLKGVIICDGDCSMLWRQLYSPGAYTLEQIVRDILRQHSSLGFVLTVGVETRSNWAETDFPLKPALFVQSGLPEAQVQALTKALNAGLLEIPEIIRTPGNTLRKLKLGSPPPYRISDRNRWSVSLGNFMENTTITLSARNLTALLGGEIDLKDFRVQHSIPTNNGTPPIDPLQRVLQEGRMLVDIRLEETPGTDDDHILLTFGKADPAKVKFRAPESRI